MLELKNIHISYKNKECVKNSDFIAYPYCITGIYGESGTGKSSLLYVLGMLSDQSCEYYYNGKKLVFDKKQKQEFRKKNISLISQNSMLIDSLTVKANIEFFLSLSNVMYTVDELLDLVGLSDKGDSMPNSLSGGERQRAAIACAIAKDSEIILGDELTSAQDDDNKEMIMKLLRMCADQGKIVIIVSHEEKVLDDCDMLYCIEHLELTCKKNINKVSTKNNKGNQNVQKDDVTYLHKLLFHSSKNRKWKVLVICLVLSLISIVCAELCTNNVNYMELYNYTMNDVSKNKILILNDESNRYHVEKWGYAMRTIEKNEPFESNVEEQLLEIDDLSSIYDYYQFDPYGFNKNGGSYDSSLKAYRNGEEILKKTSDENTVIRDYFTVLPYYDEETYVVSTEGVYVNDNLAYVYNLEVGDTLKMNINVPYAMIKSQELVSDTLISPDLGRVEGPPYYSVSCIYESVSIEVKVLGIIESNSSFQNELYMYHKDMESLIHEQVEKYQSGQIKINEDAYSLYDVMELQPYAKVGFVNQFEQILNVKNQIQSISDKIFVYNEYQSIVALVNEGRQLWTTTLIVSSLTLVLFVLAGTMVNAFYVNKYKSMYMMLKLVGYEWKIKLKIVIMQIFYQIINTIMLGGFIYFLGSIPDILIGLNIITFEDKIAVLQGWLNVIFSVASFSWRQFALSSIITIFIIVLSNIIIMLYYEKKETLNWLRE